MASSSPYIISQCSPFRKQINPSTLNLEQSQSKLQVQADSVAFNTTQSSDYPHSKMQHHPLDNNYITSINNTSTGGIDQMTQYSAYNYHHYHQLYPNIAASLPTHSATPISITNHIMSLTSSQNSITNNNSNISTTTHPAVNYYTSHGDLADQQTCSVNNSPFSANHLANLTSHNSNSTHDNFTINSFALTEMVSSATTSAATIPGAAVNPSSYTSSADASLAISNHEDNAGFQSSGCYWGFEQHNLSSPAAATENEQWPSTAAVSEARAAMMTSSGVSQKSSCPITSPSVLNSDAITNHDANCGTDCSNYAVISDGANHDSLRVIKPSMSDSEDNDMPGTVATAAAAAPAARGSVPASVAGKAGGGNVRKRAREASGNGSNNGRVAHSDCPDVIHVRARRGQATDSHSLAERVRRERISQRMKLLQELVPSCNKVLGKAAVLEEIINYVKSLQHQIEFLSMKLAASASSTNFVRQLEASHHHQKRMCLIDPWVELQSFHGHNAS